MCQKRPNASSKLSALEVSCAHAHARTLFYTRTMYPPPHMTHDLLHTHPHTHTHTAGSRSLGWGARARTHTHTQEEGDVEGRVKELEEELEIFRSKYEQEESRHQATQVFTCMNGCLYV